MLTIMKVKNCAIGCALLMVGLGAFGATLEHKKVIVVVDGYSTGKHLAPLFRGNGYEVVHVSSKIGRGLGIPLIGHDYLENIEYTNELAPVLHRLAPYQVQAIIAGAEAGVFLADELSNELKLPTSNSMEQSKARRDKFLMQEALAKNGISSIKQFKSSKVEEVVSWSRTNGIMPIVIKPISSAGTDGVTYCYSEFELREAFRTIMTTPDIYGEKNIEVLAQEMIIGTDPGVEYMVNTVSSFGRHHIAEIWKTRKRVIRNVPLYDSAELPCVQWNRNCTGIWWLRSTRTDHARVVRAGLPIATSPIAKRRKTPPPEGRWASLHSLRLTCPESGPESREPSRTPGQAPQGGEPASRSRPGKTQAPQDPLLAGPDQSNPPANPSSCAVAPWPPPPSSKGLKPEFTIRAQVVAAWDGHGLENQPQGIQARLLA